MTKRSPWSLMHPLRAALSLAVLTVTSACGLDVDHVLPRTETRPESPTEIAPEERPEPTEPTEPIVVEPRDLPLSLTCASDELAPNDGSRVARLSMWLGTEAGGVLSFGPAFRTHRGALEPAPTTDLELNDIRVTEADGTAMVDTSEGTLLLERSGAFWVGELSQPHQVFAVACWDLSEVLGNAWSGTPGLLQARFDWETGDCRDSEGAPARNEVPIQFVRETGIGDCADLRGALLNGTDYGYPQLEGLSLAGADLSGAQLFFADLRYAFLPGADLSELSYGYAEIDGTVDDHTRLPAEGCEVTRGDFGDTVACRR